ncbi:adenine nucleotide alpha hydrolase family protein [Aeromicrobium terrae]|uniref:Asparagine synthetase domain-containing protein n=1 Tax=Aeromicrobium terrae TaxID=2498846 RepID=A0A5C8NKM7_9ACTN|nr:hypothetical protein [Aeromicrobium terrae]TXL62319.1 hypothetical protein FHP06_06400 [Aeromicrobium terrae]
MRDPVDEPTPAEIVTLIDDALLGHPALGSTAREHRATVPITGGWDSRLLAARAVSLFGPRDLRTITSAKHTLGETPDVTLGGRLAAHLNLPHVALFPPPDEAVDSLVEAYRVSNFETSSHAWLVPVARRLRSWHLPVIDGLAGDILLKNKAVSVSSLEARSGEPVREVHRAQFFKVPPSGVPGANGVDLMVELALPLVDTAYRAYEGLREEARVMMLAARTARVISLAPYGLLEPDAELVTPLAHPEVMAALLAVPWPKKTGGVFARSLLEAARPGLSDLPSTNDLVPPPTTGVSRWDLPDVLAWEDARLLELRERTGIPYERGQVGELLHPRKAQWRQGLLLLALWLETYGHRLTCTAAPWW